jgi:hypothetical protein
VRQPSGDESPTTNQVSRFRSHLIRPPPTCASFQAEYTIFTVRSGDMEERHKVTGTCRVNPQG